jgi:hypothetical protein
VEFIVVAVVIVLVVAFVAYPLFSAPERTAAPVPEALDGLIAQRDSAYDAIRDLDLDFQLGKLSQNDYDALREKYKLRAASALAQIDAMAGQHGTGEFSPALGEVSPGAGEEIEAEVARLRRHARAGSNGNARPMAGDASPADGDPVDREVARLRGRRSSAANGDAIEQEVARLRARRRPAANAQESESAPPLACANCGAPRAAGDRFCSKCGAALT